MRQENETKMVIRKAKMRIQASLSILFVLVLTLPSFASVIAQQQEPPDPLPRIKGGQKAIDSLGNRLPNVAANYGMTARLLENLFLQDSTLHISNGEELFHIDEAFPGDTQALHADLSTPSTAPFPSDQTFLLNSLPGANHTIYLDFDGHVTENTSWNSGYGVPTIVSPAYDTDGNSSLFSVDEIEVIQKTWQIVAEDFRPFNVNITTQDPGTNALRYQGGGDTQWGTRVVITNDTFADCGCGGFAYIGSFDDSQDEPVFVFNTSLTGVAEASSHEVGHALILSHDGRTIPNETYYRGHGSGETSWAPIMGAGYYKSVTQWSKGEYYASNNAGANANYGYGPDDLAIIASLTNGNGFGYRADDHVNSSPGASPQSVVGDSVSGTGIIERSNDVDVFSFSTGAGNVSFSIVPFSPNYNLDVLAELYDDTGSLVASSNPAPLVAATINATVSQGTYYLHIDGIGTGDPYNSTPTGYTEYGSLGEYNITGTIVPIPGPFSKINPVDGAKEVSVTPTLRWESSSGASGYEVCFDDLDNDVCDFWGWWIMGTDTSVSFTGGLGYNSTYYWQVRAINDAGGITYANNDNWWEFTIEPAKIFLPLITKN